MLKFRPITYADTDLRAFHFSGASGVQEGQFCQVLASTDLNTFICGAFSGTAPPTIMGGPTATIFDPKRYFPIYLENPDVEDVSATINNGVSVVGFAMKSGNEFEIHKSQTETGFATSFSDLGQVCLGSNGKLTHYIGTNSTSLVLGVCLGTYNGWVRIRAI